MVVFRPLADLRVFRVYRFLLTSALQL
jgi:hypothetical protein